MAIDDIEVSIIYKPASVSTEGAMRPVPLKVHATELKHFGIRDIYAACVSNWTGKYAPDGGLLVANVFAIKSVDWQEFQTRIDGAFGFRNWQGADFPELKLPDGAIIGPGRRVCIEDIPIFLREIIGRKQRVYQTNDSLDRSRDPSRINLETDLEGTIVGVWIG